MRIAVLVSGRLGYDMLKKINKEYIVIFVCTDNRSTDILNYCDKNTIPCFRGNPREGKAKCFLEQFEVDVVVSINYLFLVDEDIIVLPKKLIFNIHGSLLPKYRGRTPHVWAIINGENKAGITAHKIELGCDTGAIIEQIEVPILKEETGADILNKYNELYFPLVKKVLCAMNEGKLKFREQDTAKATYFGKRTPDDGEINWSNNSEDIRNWVRAQAAPYPGAFTFYQNQKIIIDRVSLIEYEFSDKNQNGEILEIYPNIIVKTQNGTLSVDVIRMENCIFDIGNLFSYENRK